MPEWRCFYPLSPCAFDLFDALGLQKSDFVEKRTDTYFVSSPSVGLKARHGKSLELKLRTKRKKKTGAERWEKFHFGQYSTVDAKLFSQVTAEHAGLSGDPLIQEAIAIMANNELPSVLCHKTRVQGSFSAAVVEQTDISVSLQTSDGQLTPLGDYRSISVEGVGGKAAARIVEQAGVLASHVAGSAILGCCGHTTCYQYTGNQNTMSCLSLGYPGFVAAVVEGHRMKK